MRFLIAAILFVLAVPAHAEWWEAETAHFVVKSRASKEDTRQYALEMEKFDASLRILFGLPLEEGQNSRANKPTIYRVGRPKDMARLAGASGSGIGGFFISRAGNSVAFAPTRKSRVGTGKTSWQLRNDPRADFAPRSVLLHEYTHYFMMQHFPAAYPRWYVEGFAEMMASARFDEDGSVHIGDPPQYRATQIFRLKPFPMDEMLDPDYELSGLDALQHYATGWLLAHYLSFDRERQVSLRKYLKAISDGENGLEAAKREFGDLRELDKALDRYKEGPFPGLRISSVDFDNTVKLRELTAAEEDAIGEEMRVRRGALDDDDARDLVSDIRKDLDNAPGNIHLLTLLGRAQLAADEHAAADSTAQQILAQDEGNGDAWLIRTMAAIEHSKDDAAMAEKAREYASQAAAADRDDPRPLIAYYYSYVVTGEEVPEMAAVALEQAFKNAGSDTSYRLLLARQLLLEDRLPSAQIVMMPIAFRGHKTEEPENTEDPSLTRIIALIRDGDRDGALAMVEEMMDDEEEDADA